MQIIFDVNDLRPLIEQIVTEVVKQVEEVSSRHGERIAYTEPEAAALLGVAPHVLRDCRLRGEVEGSKCGKRIVYRREDLFTLLEANRSR